jgi:hypothetical protein
MLKQALVAVSMLVVWGCQPARQDRAQESDSKPTQSIVGIWKLNSVAGGDPSSINIETYDIEFEQGGTWRFAATMNGSYLGMKMNGSGAWSLKGNTLEFTFGENKGEVRMGVSQDALTLSPDPVLRRSGTDEVETVYKRVPTRDAAPN